MTDRLMASAQVVETSVTNNSPSQASNHPDYLFQSRLISYFDCFNGCVIRILLVPVKLATAMVKRRIINEVAGSNSVEVLTFQASIRNSLNCVHNCDDHSLLDHDLLLSKNKGFRLFVGCCSFIRTY